MANQVTAPRGMRDFLPAQSIPRQELIAKISASYLSRGFQSIETPLLEDLDRLLSGQGGDNEKLVFKVQKRGDELERAVANGEELADLGLRFDLTVPLTRYYASNHAKLPRVFKAMQIGPVFRAERPQKGRYRQFMQCDIDIIGDDSVSAEAELVIASLAALQSIGLSGATIRINHRDLLKSNIEALGIADSDALAAMIVIDKLDKIGIEGVASELGQLFGDSVADKAANLLKELDAREFPELLRPLVEAVGDSAEYLRFDPTLVRGMGYYTGTIFEIEHPDASSSIGGGGRYDGMVGKWLGKDVPAVGISLGFERIADLLGESGASPQFEVLVYEPELLATAIRLQSELVAKGRAIRIEKKPKNLKVLLDDMSAAGANQFAILSEEITNIENLEFKPLS